MTSTTILREHLAESARQSVAPSSDSVRAISVVSTGMVEIHPQHAFGSRIPTYAWILASQRWLPPRPINVYVIEHTEGLVLFDTGQDRASVVDPSYFPGGPVGFLYNRLARFHIRPEDTLGSQLRANGYDLRDVRKVVISHLHQDHIGGLSSLRGTGAEVLLAQEEWAEMARPFPEVRGILRQHIELPGLRWRRIAFEPISDPSLAPFDAAYDLMGDGSLLLLPTPGHTSGSVSLLVRRAHSRPALMVGDLTYEAELLEQGRIPGVGDKAQLRLTTDRVRQLGEQLPGLTILPAHDPGATERLRRANVR